MSAAVCCAGQAVSEERRGSPRVAAPADPLVCLACVLAFLAVILLGDGHDKVEWSIFIKRSRHPTSSLH